jgi:hypothetical protein
MRLGPGDSQSGNEVTHPRGVMLVAGIRLGGRSGSGGIVRYTMRMRVVLAIA